MNFRFPLLSSAVRACILRAAAALSAGLVLLLAVLAASPELHSRLHGEHTAGADAAGRGGVSDGCGCARGHHPSPQGTDTIPDDDAGCIVELFAVGVPVLVPVPLVPPLRHDFVTGLLVADKAGVLRPLAHAYPPSHAPPLRGA